MNEEMIEWFREGYNECRMVIIKKLREILDFHEGDVSEISNLIYRLEEDQERELSESIQKEFPGITPDEYEAELSSDIEMIYGKYYRKDGTLKMRLVRGE